MAKEDHRGHEKNTRSATASTPQERDLPTERMKKIKTKATIIKKVTEVGSTRANDEGEDSPRGGR
jgi:hypothetical protein